MVYASAIDARGKQKGTDECLLCLLCLLRLLRRFEYDDDVDYVRP